MNKLHFSNFLNLISFYSTHGIVSIILKRGCTLKYNLLLFNHLAFVHLYSNYRISLNLNLKQNYARFKQLS